MKVIEQTPFYKETGELSFMDRGRAILQFGAGWIKDVEGQKAVISVLGKTLDKNFTLLHNVTPPGLGIMIPIILVGTTGIYVMSVTSQTGMFSARGDQWGVISGGAVKLEKPNLLTRTEKFARAIQLYIQQQGHPDVNTVEPILLCSEPATNVDSVRPIIRVVMRDALERFAISISQARPVLNPESVFDIVERIMRAPASPQSKPEMPSEPVVQKGEAVQPIPTTPGTVSLSSSQDSAGSSATMPPLEDRSGPPFAALSEDTKDTQGLGESQDIYPFEGSAELPPAESPVDMPPESDHEYLYPFDSPNEPAAFDASGSLLPFENPQDVPPFDNSDSLLPYESYQETPQDTYPQNEPVIRRRKAVTGKQLAFLIGMFVIWLIIAAVFAFLIVRDFLLH